MSSKLSVHVWNHDLIWWQNKIGTQKHFHKTRHKTTITSSWTLSKTKFHITIVKAQMPSNPNQKSRMRDKKHKFSNALEITLSILDTQYMLIRLCYQMGLFLQLTRSGLNNSMSQANTKIMPWPFQELGKFPGQIFFWRKRVL